MAVSEQALIDELNRIKTLLTAKQNEFLDAREHVASDAEACRAAGISDTSIPRWKKQSTFMEAYVMATKMVNAQRAIIVSDVNRMAIVRAQQQALLVFLPTAVQTLIKVILDSKSDEFRLRAIKQLFDTVGLSPDNALPVSKQNQALLNVLKLVAPQARNEAAKRGLSVDADIKEVVAAHGPDKLIESIATNDIVEEDDDSDSGSEGGEVEE
jgi:hypothetical protein